MPDAVTAADLDDAELADVAHALGIPSDGKTRSELVDAWPESPGVEA